MQADWDTKSITFELIDKWRGNYHFRSQREPIARAFNAYLQGQYGRCIEFLIPPIKDIMGEWVTTEMKNNKVVKSACEKISKLISMYHAKLQDRSEGLDELKTGPSGPRSVSVHHVKLQDLSKELNRIEKDESPFGPIDDFLDRSGIDEFLRTGPHTPQEFEEFGQRFDVFSRTGSSLPQGSDEIPQRLNDFLRTESPSPQELNKFLDRTESSTPQKLDERKAYACIILFLFTETLYKIITSN
jgi:hypothetical protein